jgi:hypothetical protein
MRSGVIGYDIAAAAHFVLFLLYCDSLVSMRCMVTR